MQMKRGIAISQMSMTWFYLLLYQLLRVYSLYFNRKEFVMPCKGSRYDFFQERRVTKDEMLMFAFQMVVFVVISILKLK